MAENGIQAARAAAGVVDPHRGEPRWAMAVAMLMAEALHATLLPSIRTVGQVWCT